jgi:hypothetical protein
MGYIISSNLDYASVTTRVFLGLYIIMKSYLKNNNNHAIIFPKTCG